MCVVVSLGDIVNEMTEIGADETAFLNRRTGELLSLNDEQRYLLENSRAGVLSDEERALQEALESGDLMELPSTFEHHQYSIVEQFCRSVNSDDHRDELLGAIRGKRAFRDFTVIIRRTGLEGDWLHFRDRAFEEIALAWLEANNVAYKRAA
ncbi:MAG: UPF0158 family protein [Planctomycetota bacterium]|jgi:hypothetical protein